MAVGTVVKSTQRLKLAIGNATTTGGTTVGQFYQLPLLSPPSIVDITAPLDSAPQILGKYNLERGHSAHNRTNQMIEISFSVLCSPTVLDLMCLFAFEDGDGTNQLDADYTPPAWIGGATATDTQNIYIGGGGFDKDTGSSDSEDVYYQGCVCTSFEITHAIDSEAGKPVANMTFITAYPTNYGDDMSDGVWTPTSLTGDSAINFTDWAESNTAIHSASSGYEIHPYSYSVSMARDIQRVGCADYTNYEPDGYVMQGGWDISMNMVYKRDENFELISQLFDSQQTYIKIGDGSEFDIRVFGKMSEHSVDTGSPELRNSITIKGMGNIESSLAIIRLMM